MTVEKPVRVPSWYGALATILEPVAAGWGQNGDPAALRARRGLDVPSGTAWIHAASVGEATGVTPLVQAWQERHPEDSWIVSALTPGGRAALSRATDFAVTTPPYDKVSIARRVVRESGIRRLLLLETELWPAWLAAAFDAGVRVAVANARLSDRGWPRYRRLRSSWAPLVSRLTAVCAQTEIDAERWRELGVPAERVRVTGNTKYEAAAALEPATEDERAAARRRFGLDPNKVWCVIGSLRPGEEKWIEPALSQVSDDVDFLVVPRHPEFWRGKPLAGEGSGRVVWVLELGVLLDAYRAADFAVIGGTIGGYGGHNALEPAALGLPVVLGPSIENIREVAEALVREHGAVQAPDFHHVTSHLAFIRTLQSYGSSAVTRRKASQAARRVAESFGGAAARVIDFLEERGFWP